MDQERAIDKHIPKQMAKMLEGINSRQDYRQPVTDQDRKMHADYMRMSRLDPVKPCLGRAEKYVAVVGNCISCGICRSVCPHGSWKIEDRAIPEGVCEGCMACIHNCPQKAITLQPSPTMPDFPEIRSITGHQSQKVFENYIRIGISEQAQRVGDKILAAKGAKKKKSNAKC